MEREGWLSGFTTDPFMERAAYYACEINAVHPFREGNGRAVRFYLDVLSAHTRGDLFDWTLISEHEYLQACVAVFTVRTMARWSPYSDGAPLNPACNRTLPHD